MLYIFSIITIVSFFGIVGLLAKQKFKLSRGEAVVADGSNVHLLIEPTIDFFAFQFVVLCRESGKRLALFTLSLAHEGATFLRQFSVWLEHKFSYLINLVKGRGIHNNRGSVSFFLREIDEYKRTLTQN